MASKYLLDRHQQMVDEFQKNYAAEVSAIIQERNSLAKSMEQDSEYATEKVKKEERQIVSFASRILFSVVVAIPIYAIFLGFNKFALFGLFGALLIWGGVVALYSGGKLLKRQKALMDSDKTATNLLPLAQRWVALKERAETQVLGYPNALRAVEKKFQAEEQAYKQAVKSKIPVYRKQLSGEAVRWLKGDFKIWYKCYYRPDATIFDRNCWAFRVEKAHVESCTGDKMVFGVYGMQPLRDISDRSAMAYVMGRTMKELIQAKFPALSVEMAYDDYEIFIYL